MIRFAASTRALAAWLVFAFGLSGCVHLDPLAGRVDVDRLLRAIDSDDVGYVQALVKSGAVSVDARIPAPAYVEGTPLITIAARSASLRVLGYLIAAGADLNARTPAHETALMLAAFFYEKDRDRDRKSFEQHWKATLMLVEAGAFLENDPYHYTPLAYAAYQGNEQVIAYLLQRGARVDADAQDGITYINTPLMMAAIEGHQRAALTLLRAGANARIRVVDGHTAAELAEKHGKRHLLRNLYCAEALAPGELFRQRCE